VWEVWLLDEKKPKVAVVMGSDSDYPVLEECIKLLKKFGVEVEAMVCSAHRTPDRAAALAKEAESKGIDVIIGAAGKAAHLPGVLASYTTLPVIGLPIKSSLLDGLDSLLSIVQMPVGVPVATVAVNGSANAALLAIRIMALKYRDLSSKLEEYRADMARAVNEKDRELQQRLKES
jgi:5-(carboxyamino)imidazole ribonucleotide mutase